ncbi:glycerophosphodiester phosphodiesterase family protein [Streptomyces sp. FXJ1.4098]|nr:glycerophosphodiester phosphodiesterase family protein [Streptomyces sp. FXJ1.4098]
MTPSRPATPRPAVRPLVYGHRGARADEPENTLRSFRRAHRVGAEGVELDVRVSRDGHLVVIHDATVDRTTDGTGEVAALSLAELRELDAGQGERIPTLREALDAFPGLVQVEIKAPERWPLWPSSTGKPHCPSESCSPPSRPRRSTRPRGCCPRWNGG